MNANQEYGHIKIKLQELIMEKNIRKSYLSYTSSLTRGQINKLCKEEAARADFNTLARLCHAFNCKIEDLLEYIPPENPD